MKPKSWYSYTNIDNLYIRSILEKKIGDNLYVSKVQTPYGNLFIKYSKEYDDMHEWFNAIEYDRWWEKNLMETE